TPRYAISSRVAIRQWSPCGTALPVRLPWRTARTAPPEKASAAPSTRRVKTTVWRAVTWCASRRAIFPTRNGSTSWPQRAECHRNNCATTSLGCCDRVRGLRCCSRSSTASRRAEGDRIPALLGEIERVLSAVPLAPLAIDRCISNANSRREKRRQLGADDERPQQGGGMAETPRDPGKVVEQFVDRVRAPVGERTLEVVPHELVGIELRRVRGEALHVQAGMAREERGDRRPAVD